MNFKQIALNFFFENTITNLEYAENYISQIKKTKIQNLGFTIFDDPHLWFHRV